MPAGTESKGNVVFVEMLYSAITVILIVVYCEVEKVGEDLLLPTFYAPHVQPQVQPAPGQLSPQLQMIV
jgi:hypothetical protein